MKNLRNLVFAVVSVSSLALMGCGSTFSCSDKGSCSNDPAPTQAQIDSCNKIMAAACGSQFKTYGQCAKDNATCGSDGKSTVAAGKCDTQLSAFTTCCTGNAAACSGM